MLRNLHSAFKIALLALTVLLLTNAARAASPNRAALVVRFANGSVETRCIEFEESQITGYDLLTRAGIPFDAAFTPGLGAAVCSIGGQGCSAENCFCKFPDYWSYWVDNGSGWTYSPSGSSGVVVRDGTLNGWVWGRGDTPPPAYAFTEICPPAAAPTNTPVPPAPTPTVILIPTDAPVTVTPSPQPSATNTETPAISSQPSAISTERSAVSGEPSATRTETPAVSSQPSATSTERSAVSGQPSAISTQPTAQTPATSTVQPNNRTTEQPDNQTTEQPNTRPTETPDTPSNLHPSSFSLHPYLGFGLLLIGLALALIAAALRGQA